MSPAIYKYDSPLSQIKNVLQKVQKHHFYGETFYTYFILVCLNTKKFLILFLFLVVQFCSFSLPFFCFCRIFMSMIGSNKESMVTKNKKASIWTIFMHADGVDLVLMFFGLIGAVGDGFTLPLTLFITSKLMNNIGATSNLLSTDVFTHHINQVC